MKTEEEILKGLGICQNGACDVDCPYYVEKYDRCRHKLEEDAKDLICRMQEENRALRTETAVNTNSTTVACLNGPTTADCKGEESPDQAAKQDNGKLDPTLVPTAGIWAIAAIRQFGLTKYKDPLNYRTVAPERLRAAAYRHFLKYITEPKRLDEESGYPHLWHCVTNLFFLCELELEGYKAEGVNVNDE